MTNTVRCQENEKNGQKAPIEKEINAMTTVDWDAMGAIDHNNQLNFLGAGLRREHPDATRERQTRTDRADMKEARSSLFLFFGPWPRVRVPECAVKGSDQGRDEQDHSPH